MTQSKRTLEAVEMLHKAAKDHAAPPLSPREIDDWLVDLRELCMDYGVNLDAIKAAFKAHRRDPKHGSYGSVMPKLADIVRHLPKQLSQYPDASLAWSKALEACNGENTVYVTPLILQAWDLCEACESDFARQKAFISAYELLVESDKYQPVELRQIKWFKSTGRAANTLQEEFADRQAVQMGWASPKVIEPYLALQSDTQAFLQIAYAKAEQPMDEAVKLHLRDWARKIIGAAKLTPLTTVAALHYQENTSMPTIVRSTAPMPAPQRLRIAA